MPEKIEIIDESEWKKDRKEQKIMKSVVKIWEIDDIAIGHLSLSLLQLIYKSSLIFNSNLA